jgi:hypothetical protein
MNSPVIAKVAVIARSVSDVAIHVPGLRGLPRYARSDGVRFKVRVRYRAGFGGLAMTAI